jgi:hypothetical protein
VKTRLLERLTDAVNKKPGSNVEKLMSLVAHHIQENEDTLTQIGEWRDIDTAQGAVLDRIGRNVQQERGQASDEVYRILIKSKIMRNLSDGSINTLIEFLSFILQIDKTQIQIREQWQEGLPANIHVNVPSDAIMPTGLTLTQFGRLVNLVVAIGVKANVLFEGTFSFSADYNNSELENPNGFADDAGTTGGTLGHAYDPNEDIELPL